MVWLHQITDVVSVFPHLGSLRYTQKVDLNDALS